MERSNGKDIITFVIKLVILALITISYVAAMFLVALGIPYFSWLHFYLTCLTVLLVLAPILYLLYKIMPIKNKRLNEAFRWLATYGPASTLIIWVIVMIGNIT